MGGNHEDFVVEICFYVFLIQPNTFSEITIIK